MEISKALPSAVAEAPTPGPSEMNITGIMSAHGCKVFTDTLLANHEAMGTYEVDGHEGTNIVPFEEPLTGSSYVQFSNHSSGTIITNSPRAYNEPRNIQIPVAKALKIQLDVQKTSQAQLEDEESQDLAKLYDQSFK